MKWGDFQNVTHLSWLTLVGINWWNVKFIADSEKLMKTFSKIETFLFLQWDFIKMTALLFVNCICTESNALKFWINIFEKIKSFKPFFGQYENQKSFVSCLGNVATKFFCKSFIYTNLLMYWKILPNLNEMEGENFLIMDKK